MASGKLVWIALLTVIVFVSACQQEEQSQFKSADPVQLMANLHCEAVSLRKARFELADKMRFMEDTLIQSITSDSTKARLQFELTSLEPYKDSVVTRSLELAKVIKLKLDSLIEQEFTEMKQRETFDAQLTDELERRGCL